MTTKDLEIWFAEAQNDFEAAEILRKSKKFNNAVFLYVQAAEKAVKGLLYYYNIQAWGHSIRILLKEYEKQGHQVGKELKKVARELEFHYISSRYPDASPSKSPKDAYDETLTNEIREKALMILNYVKKERKELTENEKKK